MFDNKRLNVLKIRHSFQNDKFLQTQRQPFKRCTAYFCNRDFNDRTKELTNIEKLNTQETSQIRRPEKFPP